MNESKPNCGWRRNAASASDCLVMASNILVGSADAVPTLLPSMPVMRVGARYIFTTSVHLPWCLRGLYLLSAFICAKTSPVSNSVDLSAFGGGAVGLGTTMAVLNGSTFIL